jgi:hypothetical protein
MTTYLENEICDFEPLFKIDYNQKINILTTCFLHHFSFKTPILYKKNKIKIE